MRGYPFIRIRLFTPVFLAVFALMFYSCSNINDLETVIHFPSRGVKILALGDSYTIGQSVSRNESWPAQLKDSLLVNGIQVDTMHVVARTGWTTNDLIHTLNQDSVYDSYDLVGLLIGVNNQFQGRSEDEYRTEFTKLVEFCLGRTNGDIEAIFIMSIPDYGVTPVGKDYRPSDAINRFNHINKQISQLYKLMYFDINPLSKRAEQNMDLIAYDGLHFSGSMYTLWVRLMLPEILQMVQP
ncbi:MAG: SGNH/GDSL hydrolase family protein [Caldithrix sp.]|nr:SGNH/GDSL hydrolase family protein [Caldithrix sp.]